MMEDQTRLDADPKNADARDITLPGTSIRLDREVMNDLVRTCIFLSYPT